MKRYHSSVPYDQIMALDSTLIALILGGAVFVATGTYVLIRRRTDNEGEPDTKTVLLFATGVVACLVAIGIFI